MCSEIYKEEDFYNNDGWPTESFKYCNYRLNESGGDYDEFALVDNALYPYVRLAKKRGNNHYPCGRCLSPATDGWFATLTNAERDKECPKIAWGIAAEFLANLKYDHKQDDYVLLKPNDEIILNYYRRYLNLYLEDHNGLRYSALTGVEKELAFIAEHEEVCCALWKKSESLKAYSQLYEYATCIEDDYQRYIEGRKRELQNNNVKDTIVDPSFANCIKGNSDEIYLQILDVINRVGRNFERHPSLVKTQNEESIRSFFLVQLNSAFTSFSATGEAFNHKGKTDIMVMHDGNVIFIAECKVWKGRKSFLDAIDQLLSYLTWKDTKTSLLIFVKNTNVTKVVGTIKECIVEHQLYISQEDMSNADWYSFKFRLPQDAEKVVQVAVQVFDFN